MKITFTNVDEYTNNKPLKSGTTIFICQELIYAWPGLRPADIAINGGVNTIIKEDEAMKRMLFAFAYVLMIGMLLTNCGGSGGSSTSGTAIPTDHVAAIMNASTDSAITTHWQSSPCLDGNSGYGTWVELASDNTVRSRTWNSTNVSGTWSKVNDSMLIISYTPGSTGNQYLATMQNISGSYKSGTFSADSIDNWGHNNHCIFTLAAGKN